MMYDPSEADLCAGAAIADITPPVEVGLLTSSVKRTWAPFESVRSPLKARVVVLKSGEEQAALVSLDLLGLTGTAVDGWDAFKSSLSVTIPPERIIITCTHTHNAPESVALTDLHETKPFRDWMDTLTTRIAGAISEASSKAETCAASITSTEVWSYSLQRRIPTAAGIVMSDSLQPIDQELMEREPIDRRIRCIRLRGEFGATIATIVHGVCHPVHEMCQPHISPDFPGEMCAALETSPANGVVMFLNGAAGDINPPTVSCGPANAKEHGRAIAKAVDGGRFDAEPLTTAPFRIANRELRLATREVEGLPKDARVARLSGLRIGDLAMLFVPGEPFVETALQIERTALFRHTIVTAFSESSIGYVPPAHAFAEGGYETGPGLWSYLDEGAEVTLRQEAIAMLQELSR